MHEKGELEEAASSYRRAVEIRPEFSGAWSNLGIVLKKLDQVSPAIEAFERAIRIKPDFVEAKTNLCVAQHQQGQTNQAIRGLRQIVAQHPNAIIPANKLMEMQFEQGDIAAAAQLAQKIRNTIRAIKWQSPAKHLADWTRGILKNLTTFTVTTITSTGR